MLCQILLRAEAKQEGSEPNCKVQTNVVGDAKFSVVDLSGNATVTPISLSHAIISAMPRDAETVYSALLTLPFEHQRTITIGQLLQYQPELQRINVVTALEALEKEGKVALQRIPGRPVYTTRINSAHHEQYKAQQDIETLVQSTGEGTFKNRVHVRRAILRPEIDVSGGEIQLPETSDRYPTPEAAFAAGIARAKSLIDAQEKKSQPPIS